MTAPRRNEPVLCDGVAYLAPKDHLTLLGLLYVKARIAAAARKPREASAQTEQHQQSEREAVRS